MRTKRRRRRKRINIKYKKYKLKRGRGFWDNLQKGLNNAYGYSGYY